MFNKVSKIVKNFPVSFVLYLYTIDLMPKKIDKSIHPMKERPTIVKFPILKLGIHFVENSTVYKSDDIKKRIRKYNPVKRTVSFENLFIFFNMFFID